MSVHVSSWAWKQAIGDDGAKLVLLKLADQANDDGIAWPKRETLRIECEAGHEDTVRRRIRKLRDLELVIVVPWFGVDGRQTSSTYLLPHRGVPSAQRIWELIEQTNRKGAPALTAAELVAAEAVGAFLRGGATVHTLDSVRECTGAHRGGAPTHPSIEEPFVEPSTEGANAPPVAAEAAERASRKVEISLALTAELGVHAGKLTRSERGAWERAVDELADVAAAAADVVARCAVYRQIWPSMQLTPMALTKHWTMLGVHVATAKPSGFDAWLANAPGLFDREGAHDVVDDAAHLDETERARRHQLIDERYDDTDNERSAAA